jgi:Fe-S-cluster-containing dehydrogenase component
MSQMKRQSPARQLLPAAHGPLPTEIKLSSIREKLASEKGERYWRSLKELADSDEFRPCLESFGPDWAQAIDRRHMLKLIGASLALAGLTACSSPPPEVIVPYVHEPQGLVPGHPVFYATAMTMGGYAKGVLVESHMGRPTKVEGNPKHPASLGATDPYGQASTLSLYDPDRSQAVEFEGRITSWTAFSTALAAHLEAQETKKGAGLRILTETVTSPTMAAQIRGVLKRFPMAKWHQYEADNNDMALRGSLLAFGRPINTYYRLENADIILSLDSDFLTHGPAWLRYSREWAARRQRDSGPRGMNRLYAVESTPTCTGAVADHRLSIHAREVEGFGRAVARALGTNVPEMPNPVMISEWVNAVAKDLQQHRGSSVVMSGNHQPAPVHALAHAMNQQLGNTGKTVIYTDPVEASPVNQFESLRQLVEEMKQGNVELLLILGVNPVFTAPADLDFSDAVKKVATCIHLGMHKDETAAYCQWHVPETHYLETWGDARAFDGTATIIQPLIAPLYNGHSALEVLALLQDTPPASPYDAVRGFWKSSFSSGDFERFWQEALQSGVVPTTAFAPVGAAVDETWFENQKPRSQTNPGQGMEINFRVDPSILDGRFANNGWLQELPKPLTKLTWDNAVLISPATAEHLGFDLGDLYESQGRGTAGPFVELKYHNRSIQGPVLVLQGHPENSVTVHFGFGRTRAGKVGSGHGFNAYALRGSDAPWFDSGLEIKRIDESTMLATTQHHFSLEGRDLVRVVKQEDLRKNPDIVQHGHEAPPVDETLYHAYEWPYNEYKWAMTVNLSNCIGCNSCVVACEAENNTPVLGKDQVGRGREMQWLRIDRYYSGDLMQPNTHFEPIFCMHCERAPCELVCPVHATNHSSEGINQMVYNRCVGTRFCSHNCPYKVRRFNFLQYSDYITPSMEPMYNPDVTVRSRGVMEKCTYCIQRIQEAKITASRENRKVRDGEIMTACQQACPTRVFTFGDLNSPGSAVQRSAKDPLNYGLLTDLNTRPRTTYLSAIKNPQPGFDKREGK